MPIHIQTGLPGSGKTLRMLQYIKNLSEREKRAVYYHNIKDLQLTWFELDDPKQWFTLPEGSIIVFDECQDLFPANETKLPQQEYVSMLAKHRHRGYDIFMITQHPSFLHTFVRRLADKHWHNIRAFGMTASNVHSWNKVFDAPEKTKKDSTTEIFNFPKEVYSYYKSAEVHTIQRKLPKKLIWVLLIPPLLGLLGWKAWSILNPKHYKEQITGQHQSPGVTGQSNSPVQNRDIQKPELTYIQAHVAEIADFPHTAPAYKDVVKPVNAPYPAACMESHSQGCKCFTQQGTQMQTTQDTCRQIVRNGFFIEWQQNTEQSIRELQSSPIGVSGRSPDVDRPPMRLDDRPLRASPSSAPTA